MSVIATKEVKEPFLKLIDLIIHYRKQFLGKTGIIEIPQEEVEVIENRKKIKMYVDHLIRDEVLGYVIDGKGQEFGFLKKEGVYIFNCTESYEVILDYKATLRVFGEPILKVIFQDNEKYILKRTDHWNHSINLTDTEGKLLALLVARYNSPVDRNEIIEDLQIKKSDISNNLNSIRRKLGKLEFNEEQINQMLPRYQREGVIFHNLQSR